MSATDTRLLRPGDSLHLMRPVPAGRGIDATWSAAYTLAATGPDAVIHAGPLAITPADAPAAGHVVRPGWSPGETAGWPPGQLTLTLRYTSPDLAASFADEPVYVRVLGRAAGDAAALPGVYPEKLATLESALAAEVGARTEADATLATRCLALETALPLLAATVDTLAADLAAETAGRTGADDALGGRIDTLGATLAEHGQALASLDERLITAGETTAAHGVTLLSHATRLTAAETALAAHESRLDASESALAAETAARTAGDAAMGARLVTVESATAAHGEILAKSVRVDVSQSHTPAEQAQGRANLGIVSTGGVHLGAGTYRALSAPLYSDGTWEAYFDLKDINVNATNAPDLGSTALLAFGSSFSEYAAVLLAIGGAPAFATAAAGETWGSTSPRTASAGMLFIQSVAGVWRFYLDGTLVHETPTPCPHHLALNNVFSLLGGNTYKGACRSWGIFNRALSDAERAAVMSGEVPAALAPRGETLIGESSPVSYTDNPNFALRQLAPPRPVGAVVRVTYTLEIQSGPTSGLPGLAATYFGSYSGGVSPQLLVGSRLTVEFRAVAGHDIALAHNNFVWAGSGDNTTDYTLTIHAMDTIGTCARYKSEHVTSLARWRDSSGHGRDLIPAGGVTPLHPEPATTRSECLTLRPDGTYERFGDIAGIAEPLRFAPGCWALGEHWAAGSIRQCTLPVSSLYTHRATSAPQGSAQYVYSVNASSGTPEDAGELRVQRAWHE